MKKFLTVVKQYLRFQKPDNLKVVVYCILTAATFWFFSALNKQYDATVDFPVEWKFDQDKYIATNELPEKIQMNVSGIGWNLLRANSWIKITPVTLRLSDPVAKKQLPGSYFANQVAEELDNLELNYIIEDSLKFNIDYIASQSFPVYIDSTHINLEESYRITSPITYDQDLVEITGPKEMLEAMPKDTFLVHIIETNIDEDFDSEIPFQLEYPDLMTARPQTVGVSFEVRKFEAKEVVIPITILNASPEIFLADTLATIRYQIQQDQQDSIALSLFVVETDLKTINPLDSTLQLTIKEHPPRALEAYIEFPQVKVLYNE